MTLYAEEQMNRARRVIGLVANSSPAGIDAVALELSGESDAASFTLYAFANIPFNASLVAAVEGACRANGAGPEALTVLDVALGLALADAAVQVRAEAGWRRKDLDAIGMQGVTIRMQRTPVELGGAFVTGALDMGDAASVAEATGAPVVWRFRARDMAAGGTGEPLEEMVRCLPADASSGSDATDRAVAIAILADRTMRGLRGVSKEAAGTGRSAVLGSVTLGEG